MNKYLPEGNYSALPENREYLSSQGGLERAMREGKILEATAIRCDENMNLTVDLRGARGIIPREEIAYQQDGSAVKDIAVITRVGKPVCFKILSLERDSDGKVTATLSRREAQLECANCFLSDLIPGDIIDARITHMEQFGAFVDIGCGIVSLLSVDCISVSRIAHPRDRFRLGMQIRAVIKTVDEETGRIYVTHKELLGSWEQNAALFSIGQTVAGIVRSIEDYGVFVELAPNLAGLAEYRDGVEVGQCAAVYIKNIIPERMKLKLVIVDTRPNELEFSEPVYYGGNSSHINSWEYSPPHCVKRIFTEFQPQ